MATLKYGHAARRDRVLTMPVWQNVSVTTSGGGSASGNVFVPKRPESFGHDVDGNLTGDGRWDFTWDAENRLTKLESRTDAPTGSKRRLELEYDWQGRRIRKKVTNLDTGAVLDHRKFLYDGWNLVTELNWTNNNVIRSYVWGLDLSGSEQGAGGVGGLLLIKPASGNPLFVAYDGNGNVTGLIDATTGTTSAQYEYGPFGETIRMSGAGTVAKDNPIRFSTKYQDDESDLLYYGYRYYNASTGRWMSRDPIWERGFEVCRGRMLWQVAPLSFGERAHPNLSAFLRNTSVNDFDLLGLCGSGKSDCKCGRDVTSLVFQTLGDIADTYAKASQFDKLMARNSMFGPLSLSSWDIRYLYNYFKPGPPGCEDCEETVTFQRTCVRASELNYIMYGWAIQVTGYPRWLAMFELVEALWYNPLAGDDAGAFARKVRFAEFGSDFSKPLSPAEWPHDCSPVKERFNAEIDDWIWKGLKPTVF
ncbi:MAG: RHS repeat-associated core domain-containing protein [Verrucomicrobia bacterium]|nr:RHS repeat-associated core domain-containing protein [Verrucomicrobiota bacterium]